MVNKNISNEELMDIYGWTYKKTFGKHRYVFLLGDKNMRKNNFKFIEDKILPYPKLNNQYN